MQGVGLACDQFAFDDVRLAFHRLPGLYYVPVFVFHHKFGSAKFFASGDIRLGNLYLRSIIFHIHGLWLSFRIHRK